MERHPLAVAEDTWFESAEGLSCADTYTLPTAPDKARQYLNNRLRRAFEAGWNAKERDAAATATGEGRE